MLLYMFLNNVHISMIINALRALIYQISLTQMCEHVLGLLQWTITMMQWLELLLHMWRVVENSVTVWHHWWWWIHSAKGVKVRDLVQYDLYTVHFIWCGIIKNPNCSKTISTMQRSTSICDSLQGCIQDQSSLSLAPALDI